VIRKIILLPVLICAGFESANSRYDSGCSDGYAPGFITECQIGATLVKGDWGDPNYSAVYTDGRCWQPGISRLQIQVKVSIQ